MRWTHLIELSKLKTIVLSNNFRMKSFFPILRKTTWFIFTLVTFLSICNFLIWIHPTFNIFKTNQPILRNEEYDPSLLQINSMDKLNLYAENICKKVKDGNQISKEALYPEILTEIVRKRFYHNYYAYGMGDNFMAWGVSKVIQRSWNEVWVADDILKSSYAQCGQQSLVIMELLMKKGYPVRKVFLKSQKNKFEHFVLEAYYDGSWHMFDPDFEPNMALLKSLKRPSVEQIARDTAMIAGLYNTRSSLVADLTKSITYGKINEMMPDSAYQFQNATKIFSRFCWVLYIAVYLLLNIKHYPVFSFTLHRIKKSTDYAFNN